jgi:GNAT superfamily N-acetyltransferase
VSRGPYIRRAVDTDADGIWAIFQEITETGEYLPYTPGDKSQATVALEWTAPETDAFVAVEREGGTETVLAAYRLRRYHRGRSAHVAAAGWLMTASAYGRDNLPRLMLEHALRTARKLGYRAMLFTFIPSTQGTAVALFKEHGFSIAGTIPGAFECAKHRYVDVFLMHRFL